MKDGCGDGAISFSHVSTPTRAVRTASNDPVRGEYSADTVSEAEERGI